MESSVYLGALIGTDDEGVIEALHSFGRSLGMAFQITDDILGIWGLEERTGKSTLSDIKQRKKTLPIIYSLVKSEIEDRNRLLQLYACGDITDDAVTEVTTILDKQNALGYTQTVADQYYEEALHYLKKAGLSQGSEKELKAITKFLKDRKF